MEGSRIIFLHYFIGLDQVSLSPWPIWRKLRYWKLTDLGLIWIYSVSFVIQIQNKNQNPLNPNGAGGAQCAITFFRWLFFHEKGVWRSEISWIFLIHNKLFWNFFFGFFTVSLGYLEVQSHCAPPSQHWSTFQNPAPNYCVKFSDIQVTCIKEQCGQWCGDRLKLNNKGSVSLVGNPAGTFNLSSNDIHRWIFCQKFYYFPGRRKKLWISYPILFTFRSGKFFKIAIFGEQMSRLAFLGRKIYKFLQKC